MLPNQDIAALLHTWATQIAHAWVLGVVGMAVGLGQLLHSAQVLTWRIALGRALSSGGIGMAAGASLAPAAGSNAYAMRVYAEALDGTGNVISASGTLRGSFRLLAEENKV